MKTLFASLVVIAALAVNAADAGSLAPSPRVVAKYERNFLEQSGSQTLQELLDTGIIRYFLTGGQSLLVLINGRPFASTDSIRLDGLPISTIERIEVLSGDSLGTYGGSAVRGALNVVLRNDLDGFEARTVVRMPDKEGGDGRQGSVFWGGAVGKGHMTFGVDILDREEITSQSRDYSRSVWQEGGSFNQAQNISIGGNTVWVLQRDEAGIPTAIRSLALGECDPAKGYTGPLSNPSGIRNGDKGCGFAYGKTAWNTNRYDQQSVALNLDHPLPEGADFHLDANIMQGESAFRYAPSVGVFTIIPGPDLLADINDAASPDFEVDDNDLFAAGHRFVGHGNRDWLQDVDQYDFSMSVGDRIEKDLGYEARVTAHGLKISTLGDTFVHTGKIASAIREGRYDLVNPFSDAPENLQAIEDSSLLLEDDYQGDVLTARLALEGSGFPIGGHNSAWTTGLELETVEVSEAAVYRDKDGMTYDVSEVLGSGGVVNYAGKRESAAAFGEMSLPLAKNLDFRISGRVDDSDDVGTMEAWRLGADYRPGNSLTLRSSWSTGERAPHMLHLHSSGVQTHPYIDCDPGMGPPPRSCTQNNPRQISRVSDGNPDLDPSDRERLSVSVGAGRRPLFWDVELYRLSSSGLPGQNSANWAVQNLNECVGGDRMNCIERIASEITIYDSYANIIETELTGVNTRFGWGTRTSWGVVGLRGLWRHVSSAELRSAGEEDRYPIPRDAIHITSLAKRGDLNFIWSAGYRAGYENRSGTGTFDSWTGHDLTLGWNAPLGMENARLTMGVFNVTDAGLSVNTANPSSVDGPTEASWGRTWFLTLNMRF